MLPSWTPSNSTRRRPVAVGAGVALILWLGAACGVGEESTGPGATGTSPSVSEEEPVVPGSAPDMKGRSGWSEVPCGEHELVLERRLPAHDGQLLGFSEVVARVGSIEVIGAERFDHSGDEIEFASEPFVCQSLLRIEVTEILYEDDTGNIFGGGFAELPDPPFVVTARDQFGLVSVEQGFGEVQARVDELVLGLHRTRGDVLEPDRHGAFFVTLLATDDASEVFNPDGDVARETSARFVEIRDRLGVAGVVDLVRAYREDDGGHRWRALFSDLYGSTDEPVVEERPWDELPPEERWLGYDGAYDDRVPDEALAGFEAIGLDVRLEYVGFDDEYDFAGVLSVVSDAGRGHSFSLSLAVQDHVVPALRLPGEELRLMLSESPSTPGKGELEVGRVAGVAAGQVAVIQIRATPNGQVRVVSVTERPPTLLELEAAATFGIQPDGRIDPAERRPVDDAG